MLLEYMRHRWNATDLIVLVIELVLALISRYIYIVIEYDNVVDDPS